jgi:hypothetical protein
MAGWRDAANRRRWRPIGRERTQPATHQRADIQASRITLAMVPSTMRS